MFGIIKITFGIDVLYRILGLLENKLLKSCLQFQGINDDDLKRIQEAGIDVKKATEIITQIYFEKGYITEEERDNFIFSEEDHDDISILTRKEHNNIKRS